METNGQITVKGAREHNLKSLTVRIPRNRLVVITGLSGSGKSSLAFDTIYAEGQRRYVESLSAYARQFLEQMEKPDVESIEGLPPTISIEQRTGIASPRSTVATTTEIYDYLRLLFARVGIPHCPKCRRPIRAQTARQIAERIQALPDGTRLLLLAPIVRGRKGEYREVFAQLSKEGFPRARVDGEMVETARPPALDKFKKHEIAAVIDRIQVRPALGARLAESVELALRKGFGIAILAVERGGRAEDEFASERFACPDCNVSLEEVAPRTFSFNSPYGACKACDGIGTRMEFDPDLVVPDRSLSLSSGAVEPWAKGAPGMRGHYRRVLQEFCRRFRADPGAPLADWPKETLQTLLFGSDPGSPLPFEGVVPHLERRFAHTESEYVKRRLLDFMGELPCPKCRGARLRPEALAVKLGRASIHDIARMGIEEALSFLEGLSWDPGQEPVARPILKEILARLGFLRDVGLGYLTLDRTTASLSGGESQRIRLATQVGSGLVGVCYVLDEPTIGLHPRDNRRLLDTLARLRDLGNTVILVEHDEFTIRSADWILDLGPGAGDAGGRIVAEGPLPAILASDASLTGAYLSGRIRIAVPDRRRPVRWDHSICLSGARENNLKSIRVRIPLGTFACVTGVSGSGKSTLVTEVLLKALRRKLHGAKDRPGAHDAIRGAEHLDKVVEIDQSPIGRTPRSNPATYTGLLDPVRALLAETKEARIRGYKPGRFSFNVKGGRCESCEGQGTRRIEMHFLPDLFVPCEACKGLRFGPETLEVRFKGRNIAEILAMRVGEALPFFSAFHKIRGPLQALHDVGLGYLALGQSSTTLSGGEAQRIKLASELGLPATGKTLYILDEPTSGLHFADISNLLDVLNRLVSKGNTVLVIEHNLDVVKTSDWVIDLGPEGGEAGGRVVAEGTPEELARHSTSHTGRFLRHVLAGRDAWDDAGPSALLRAADGAAAG